MKNLILSLICVLFLTAPAQAGPLHFLVNVGKAAIRTPGSVVKATVDGCIVASVGTGVVILAPVTTAASAVARISGDL